MSDKKIIEGIALDRSNEKFFQAAELVLNTNQQIIYLTGKAGTGKTTFLKYIREEYQAKVGDVVVLAPTGIAAVNAGGQTIHSFFKLDTTPYPKEDSRLTKPGIDHFLGYNSNKKNVIREMSLLVIDEVSMVRCDILDAIDRILRIYRGAKMPFGGVKVLLIGDVFQLSPIAKDEDWNTLKGDYESPYFFDSDVYKNNEVIHIELDKPYRQTERVFLDILDNIRINQVSDADLDNLNKRCTKPDLDGSIMLTPTNREVDKYNEEKYQQITSPEFIFDAIETGTFKDKIKEKNKPAPSHLRLKVGAKVMILKNKYTGDHFEYFNGSIGTVSSIDEEDGTINVKLPDKEVCVEREDWEDDEYEWDPENKCIRTKVIGTYIQFPLRLAWAITIHKSQGLTFDKVYADLGGCFASGQAYVALSRCRRLSGLYLKFPLSKKSIMVDNAVVEFSKQKTPNALIGKRIEWSKADRLYKESREYFWQNKPEEMLASFDEATMIRDDWDTDDFRRYIKTMLNLFHHKRKQNQELIKQITKLKVKEAEWLAQEAEMESETEILTSELETKKKAYRNLTERYNRIRITCENLKKECDDLKKERNYLKEEMERMRSVKWYKKLMGKMT